MQMPYILYDVAIAVVLLVFFLRGRSKGLILSLCGLLAVFVALVGAKMTSEALAPKAAQALQPHFASVIEEQLQVNLDGKLDQLLQPGEGTGSAIVDLLSTLGFYDEISSAIRDSVNGQAAQTVTDVAVSLATAVAEVVAGVLVFAVAFLLISVAWFLLSRALDLAARLPVLHGMNRLLGGLFGLLKGALVLFLAAWVVRLLGNVIPQDVVEQTVVLRFFCTANPLSLITGI